MSKYIDKAKILRSKFTEEGRPVYNCAQAVLCPFADVIGLDETVLYKMATHFGGGMKMASVCGAITGGLMALGLLGADDMKSLQIYYGKIRAEHDGLMNCADLLRVNAEKGGEKMAHCNAMIYECVGYVEEIAGLAEH